MSSNSLRDAIAEVAWASRPRPGGAAYQHGGISTADAILAMPEIQALLNKDDEITRLRAAGDALAAHVRDHGYGTDTEHAVLTAWQEACREQ